MKRTYLLFMIPLLMGLVSCGSDGGGNDPDTSDSPNANTGSDNYTDLIVTGAAGNATMDYDANFAVPITGYVNLKDEDKILYGMVMEFGVEISTSNQFATDLTQIVAASRLEDDRKFQVTINNLKAETQYYYRSYISTGNNLPVYGKTLSFKTKSIKTMIKEQNMKVQATVEPHIGINFVEFYPSYWSGNTSIACSIDRSKLTVNNIEKSLKGNVVEELTTGLSFEVEPGTTYYYCVFQVIGESNVIMGDISSFKSGGYSLNELLSYVDISVEKGALNYEDKRWVVKINSRLGNHLPYDNMTITIESSVIENEYFYRYSRYNDSRYYDYLYESEARNYECNLPCCEFGLTGNPWLYIEMNNTWSKIQRGEATYDEIVSYNEAIDEVNQYFSENGWPYYLLTVSVRIDDYEYKLKEEKWRYELPEKYN